MQEFTPFEYLQIDVANCFGLDKEKWEDRIHWTRTEGSVLEKYADHAKHPIMFRKAVRALRKVEQGFPTNHIMGPDATASGIQAMACMSGCESSMRQVNVINTGEREDIYSNVAKYMSNLTDEHYDTATAKGPVMTHFYGSKAMPERTFGKNVGAFLKTVEELLPGPAKLMRLFQSCWDPTAEYYQWVMPDGHHVRIPVTAVESKGMEIDEADHFRYTYRTRVIQAQEEGRSLAANIVHSVDAWICRQMIRRSANNGFQLATIHDCFFASPKHMQKVRETYRDLLIEVHDRDFVSDILSQIRGKPFHYKKLNNSLHSKIATAEYALS